MEARKNKTLLIGDSILKGLKRRGLKENIDIQTMRGAKTRDVYDRIQELEMSNYEKVILSIGGNDVARGKTPETLREGLKYLIESLHRRHCQVFICTLSPRRDTAVATFNEVITKLGQELKAVVIDAYHSFTNIDGSPVKQYFYTDGIHLTASGSSALVMSINKTVQIIKDQRRQYSQYQSHVNRGHMESSSNRNTAQFENAEYMQTTSDRSHRRKSVNHDGYIQPGMREQTQAQTEIREYMSGRFQSEKHSTNGGYVQSEMRPAQSTNGGYMQSAIIPKYSRNGGYSHSGFGLVQSEMTHAQLSNGNKYGDKYTRSTMGPMRFKTDGYFQSAMGHDQSMRRSMHTGGGANGHVRSTIRPIDVYRQHGTEHVQSEGRHMQSTHGEYTRSAMGPMHPTNDRYAQSSMDQAQAVVGPSQSAYGEYAQPTYDGCSWPMENGPVQLNNRAYAQSNADKNFKSRNSGQEQMTDNDSVFQPRPDVDFNYYGHRHSEDNRQYGTRNMIN